MSKKIVILGATSAMAQATSRLYAAENADFLLVGRDDIKLNSVKDDLLARGSSSVNIYTTDMMNFDEHENLVEYCYGAFGGVDIFFLFHGSLGNQTKSQENYQTAEEEIRLNFLSNVSILTPLANRMEKEGKGTIVSISSPAGDRGRQSNYIYGCAKGGLTIFLQGLRNRLHPKGVHVITVKPGFVDTPMTRDFPKGPLWVKPDIVARGIHKAIRKGKCEVYLPWFWFIIMTIIKSIPEVIFRRLKF